MFRSLYLIHWPGTSLYKVGIAYRPQVRLRQLRKGYRNPDLYIVGLWSPGNARAWELWLHGQLAEWRVTLGKGIGGCTEWFNLNEQAARVVCITVTRLLTQARRKMRPAKYGWLRDLRRGLKGERGSNES
jgi:hypothetical protein